MSIKTIEQKRAKYALDFIEPIKENKTLAKEIRSRANELPAMIHSNGLGQAVAFYKSKSNDNEGNSQDNAYEKMYQLLSDWLCNADNGDIYTSNNSELLENIINNDIKLYQMAQIEALALLKWVKKFARAYLAEGNNVQGGEDDKTE
ncbi:type III-B CRISPR module-associated protein Cmr5 [Pasteurella skyensis]|uniref:CRISPR type III-B/RAMP module-associated protein Cmr5 n=1 Tax=Phocoenobacter skyensis TaxID=97481 RepID=A0AAJ6N7R3_9PAST|nr:type III-B CRISPR module-associated protein Cmr5 [Pasteurella skyensis]MDP8161606.1 type III-B CRISPR module-associated protein Cmr5 [Pasteurella skyensis]MDP8171762.1 type III-B CRISPR module-associated protein Cmr5 [Pasteurella skyensis]MDP8176000.1 type III-B CRISPR module-associated protein Cmr5 [Pasteurella skyensis]MDP8177968.1 type III-B CRISPR module-associated protein Cmr5 [Pasteurella skyensis]MDP8182373.1 type III-B CRISPR module-associated protein Cmr5 [Pasteurella skyensis]